MQTDEHRPHLEITDHDLYRAALAASAWLTEQGKAVTIDALHRQMLDDGWAITRSGLLHVLFLDNPPEPV
jgi:hypothetical protein